MVSLLRQVSTCTGLLQVFLKVRSYLWLFIVVTLHYVLAMLGIVFVLQRVTIISSTVTTKTTTQYNTLLNKIAPSISIQYLILQHIGLNTIRRHLITSLPLL